jgi:hypothetical protein
MHDAVPRTYCLTCILWLCADCLQGCVPQGLHVSAGGSRILQGVWLSGIQACTLGNA